MKKILRIALIILVSLALLVAAFILYVNTGNDDLPSLAVSQSQLDSLSPNAVHVDNVKQYTQPDAITCSITTISITAATLNNTDIPPQSLIVKYNIDSSMKYDKFTEILSKEVPSYTATFASGMEDFELIKTIHGQLAAGIPVPVFFGAENPYNKPKYDFHASVVTGLDLQKQQVEIANAYGYTEQISLLEFLNRMSYRGGDKYPFVQRAVAKLGLQEKNALVMISKK